MTELHSAAPPRVDRERLIHHLETWAPWPLFAAFLLYAWRINPFTTLQGYGDILEFVWGTEWYWATLFGGAGSPLYTPDIFYPGGWHTATLALTPSLFLLALPFRALAGPAFGHNALVLLSYALAFAGALRFARLYTEVGPATAAALVYTFTPARGIQSVGHLHIFALTAVLPWFLLGLERLRRAPATTASGRRLVLTGLAWGALINCALYGVFVGALGLALWGRDLLKPRRLAQAAVIGGIAVLVGAPVIWLYLDAARRAGVQPLSVLDGQHWAASLNSLTIPSVLHEWPLVGRVATSVYRGLVDEGVVTNFGLVTTVLAVLGLWRARTIPGRFNLLLLTLVSFTAALGLWLKWDGHEIVVPWFASLNQALWSLGHQLKPALFPTPRIPPDYATALPLPGFVLTVLVPFWEAARTTTRHAYLGGLSLIVLGAIGLRSLPRPAQAILTLLWLAEAVPLRAGVAPLTLPMPLHPAYAWIVEHAPSPDTPILETNDLHRLALGGEVSLGTLSHGHPNAAGSGTFWPDHARRLLAVLFEPGAYSRPDTAQLLHQNGIQYILAQRRTPGDAQLWASMGQNPALRPVGCFDANPGATPWWYPICIAEVTPGPLTAFNLTRGQGWSGVESWGVWAEGTGAEASWTALARQPFELSLAANPVCLPNRPQSVSLEVNGQPLGTHTWTGCEEWRAQVVIPAEAVRPGPNTLTLRFAFAAPPIDPKTGQPVELRQLSVGFSELQVRPKP